MLNTVLNKTWFHYNTAASS